MNTENRCSPDWIIRTATEGDIPAMLSLWSGIQEIQSSVADSYSAVQGCLAANSESVLVAYSGTTLVGTVIGAYNGWRGAIYHLTVHPEYRRLGLGCGLMEECLAILRRRGAPRVDLTTYAYNERAQAFYKSLGFRERTEVKCFSYEYSPDCD